MVGRLELVVDAEGVNVTVKAKIRASRTRLVGIREGCIEVALAAPPVDGAANSELVRFLAKCTGLPQSRVCLVRGERARSKVVRFQGVTGELIEQTLLAAAAKPQ